MPSIAHEGCLRRLPKAPILLKLGPERNAESGTDLISTISFFRKLIAAGEKIDDGKRRSTLSLMESDSPSSMPQNCD